MDEYLSEKEQIDEIKQWFRANGPYLFGGVALVLVGYFGFNQYQSWETRAAEQAAAIYLEIAQLVTDDDREAADGLLAQLAAEHPDSAYLDQARLLIAEANVVRAPQRSSTELQAVVDGSGDAELVNIARLRLARVLAYQERFDEALVALNIADPGAFAARFSEVRGDIHAAMGNREAAASAYTDALLGAANGSVNTDYVQLKLNDVFQLAEPAAVVAPDAAGEPEPAGEPAAAGAPEAVAEPETGSPE